MWLCQAWFGHPALGGANIRIDRASLGWVLAGWFELGQDFFDERFFSRIIFDFGIFFHEFPEHFGFRVTSHVSGLGKTFSFGGYGINVADDWFDRRSEIGAGGRALAQALNPFEL